MKNPQFLIDAPLVTSKNQKKKKERKKVNKNERKKKKKRSFVNPIN